MLIAQTHWMPGMQWWKPRLGACTRLKCTSYDDEQDDDNNNDTIITMANTSSEDNFDLRDGDDHEFMRLTRRLIYGMMNYEFFSQLHLRKILFLVCEGSKCSKASLSTCQAKACWFVSRGNGSNDVQGFCCSKSSLVLTFLEGTCSWITLDHFHFGAVAIISSQESSFGEGNYTISLYHYTIYIRIEH